MRTRVPVLSLLAALSLSGCTLNTDYFGEYRGVNLLGNYDFDATDGGTPKWALEISPTPSDFMRWELETGVPAPDGVSPVLRLEIKNLIPNGDFEDGTVTPDGTVLPAHWTQAPPTPSAIQFGSTPSPNPDYATAAISGRALGWWGSGPGDSLSLDLDEAVLATSPTAWRSIAYRVHLDFINVSTVGTLGILLDDPGTVGLPDNDIATADNGGTWDVETGLGNASVFRPTQRFLFSSGTTDQRVLFFGSAAAPARYGAVLDNLRLVPDDLPLVVAAEFPSLSSGTKKLLPGSRKGMYTFTVAVRTDPTAGAANRFAARHFSVVITAQEKSGKRSYPITFASSEWSSAWTTLKFDLGLDMVDEDSELGGEPALRIALSPTVTNSGSVDAGSLLVSQPVLTFNP